MFPTVYLSFLTSTGFHISCPLCIGNEVSFLHTLGHRYLGIMTKSRSRSRSASRDRVRRSKHKRRSRSRSRSRKTEKHHSSRSSVSRKDNSESKYRFAQFWANASYVIPHHFIRLVYDRRRSRSISSSSSDSDQGSKKQRTSRSSKLSEVERLAEIERQRAAQNARIMSVMRSIGSQKIGPVQY